MKESMGIKNREGFVMAFEGKVVVYTTPT